jgi:hypothetical protein
MQYRVTSHSTTHISPAGLMFGRQIRSRLDIMKYDSRTDMNERSPDVRCQTTNLQLVILSNFGFMPTKTINGVLAPLANFGGNDTVFFFFLKEGRRILGRLWEFFLR